jgi:DnaK suppressor protein
MGFCMERIELPEGYEPSDSEEYMNPLQLEFFYRLLMDWKKSLQASSDELNQVLQRTNLGDPDLSDRVTGESHARFELRKGSRCRKLIDKIESAMHRIENKEYGYCSVTGQPIGVERLKVRPVATLSIEAQRKHELIEKQQKEKRFSGKNLRSIK